MKKDSGFANDEYESITVDIPFVVFQAIVAETIKYPASKQLFNELESRVEATGDYDIEEAFSILGQALVNDFVLRAIQNVIDEQKSKEQE